MEPPPEPQIAIEWLEEFSAATQKIGERIAEKAQTAYDDRLSMLEREVEALAHHVHELRQIQPLVVPVVAINSNKIRLKKAFFIVVQRDEDDYLATFFDANISASGESDVEAVDALKEIMIAKYLKFLELGPEKLGREPTRQLEILKAVMEPAN
jgi:hypothetical protein